MNDKKSLLGTSLDSFLGGKVSLYQPIGGYRANVDSVFLASSIVAKKGQTVLELGCGVGTVSICLMSRVPELKVVGIEVQKRYADLAKWNFKINGFKADILESCISQIPLEHKALKYDHVVLNPPYHMLQKSKKIKNKEKAISKNEFDLALDDWLNIAITRCAVRGKIVIIHKAERLSQILKIFDSRVGGIQIRPIISKKGEIAKRILVRGEKGSRAPLEILAPFQVHEIENSDGFDMKYTCRAERILRHGKDLNWA